MLLVILFKEPAWLRNKTTYLAGQQHLCQDIPIIIYIGYALVTPDRYRHITSSVLPLYVQGYRFIGLVRGFPYSNVQCGKNVFRISDKEKSVCQHLPLCVKDSYLMHPRSL